MEPSLQASLTECLPADLIASLDFAGVVNLAAFTAISLEEEEEGIRMDEIVDFLRERLPLFHPAAELRRFLPPSVHAALHSDDCVINAARHWSLSPGYKFLLRAAQARLCRDLEDDAEPPAKRPRLSTPALQSCQGEPSPKPTVQPFVPASEEPQQSPLSLPILRSQPAALSAGNEADQDPASGDHREESLADLSVPQTSPQCQLTPAAGSAGLEKERLNATDPGPASANRRRRRRRRGKKGRSGANTSVSAEDPPPAAVLPVSSTPVATPVQAPPPSSAHFLFDSDGDVAEQRPVQSVDRAVQLAKNRKQCKQRANFSAPNFPEMSKSAQLKSRQTNRGQNQLDVEKAQPASQLRNNRKRVFKVDIDSSSSSSSTSSSEEEVAVNGNADRQNHRPDSVENAASGQTSSQTEQQPRDYSALPSISKPPPPGSLVAFKVLELNPATVTPEVSEFKEGLLCSYDPHRDRCRIEVTTNRRRCDGEGKFDVRIESPDGLLTNYEEEESVLLTSWSCLQEVKLIREAAPTC